MFVETSVVSVGEPSGFCIRLRTKPVCRATKERLELDVTGIKRV